MQKQQPLTINQDWERFYTDYPEVYDQFAVSSLEAIRYIVRRFDLYDKTILDVGSGTGISTFEIAKYAAEVIGIEPWQEMRVYAESKQMSSGQKVKFLDYAAEADAFPFADQLFDAVISVYGFPFWFSEVEQKGLPLAKKFLDHAKRFIKPDGKFIFVSSATGWEAGELTQVVLPGVDYAAVNNRFMEDLLGFRYEDVVVKVNYGSVENMAATYGFIFGQQAINIIRENQIHQIDWKLRVHYL